MTDKGIEMLRAGKWKAAVAERDEARAEASKWRSKFSAQYYMEGTDIVPGDERALGLHPWEEE